MTSVEKIAEVVEQDNSPTPERLAKPDYETIDFKTRKRRKSNTLDVLYNKQWITGDEIEEAERWIRNYILGFGGYCDAMKNLGEEYTKGDRITFGIAQGKALERLDRFRAFAGRKKHHMLLLALWKGYSFSALGRVFHPYLCPRARIDKSMIELADVLVELSNFWKEQRKLAKAAAEKNAIS